MAILFIPFSTREFNQNLIDMAARWQAAHALHDRNFTQVENRIYQPGVRVLEDIQADEELHVLAHGQGTDYIVNDRVPNMTRDVFGQQVPVNAVLDANSLTARLRESGLGFRHKTISLSVCNINGTMSRFAAAFLTEMKFLGYRANLNVYYYAAPVSVPRPAGDGGPVVQHVIFLGQGDYIATPSGLAPLNRPVPAGPFTHKA